MVIKRTCYWRWLFTNIVLLVVTVLPLFYRSSVCLHLPTLWITFSANPYVLYKRIKRDIEKKNIKWNNLLKKPQLRWFETLWSLEYHSKARWRNKAQIWYGQFRSRISIIAKATRIYRKSLFFFNLVSYLQHFVKFSAATSLNIIWPIIFPFRDLRLGCC